MAAPALAQSKHIKAYCSIAAGAECLRGASARENLLYLSHT